MSLCFFINDAYSGGVSSVSLWISAAKAVEQEVSKIAEKSV